MTPISGALPFLYFLFFAWLECVASLDLQGSVGERMIRRDVPRVELVARGGSMKVPRLARRGNASVEYLRYATQSYNALTYVGPYAFLLSLDTGSSDTWVVSSDCKTSACRDLPSYPAELPSPSFQSVADNTTAFHIGFADGTAANGIVAQERVAIGGFVLDGQTFGLVNDTNVTLASGNQQASGVLGLGFPRLSQIGRTVTGAVPSIARLAQQGLLSYPLFGLSLKKNDTGTLSLGAIDADVVSNLTSIAWHNVAPFPTLPSDNSSIYLQWAIHMSSVSVNGTHVPINSTYPNVIGTQPLALLDLGTSGMFGPAADVARLFSLIPASRLVGDGQYAVPCDTALTMGFTFGNRNYTLQPHEYIYARVQDPPNMCLAWPVATAPSSDGIDWQLGTPFLRTVYSVFSYGINNKEPPKIGLYQLSNGTTGTDTEEGISFSLSVESATYATTLPNVVLPTPTYTTPPYLFSLTSSSASSVSSGPSETGPSLNSSTSTFIYSVPTLGQPVRTGLGASTYSALLTRSAGTAAPQLPIARESVVVLTDLSGSVATQPIPMQTAVLGGPQHNAGERCDSVGALVVVFAIGVLACIL